MDETSRRRGEVAEWRNKCTLPKDGETVEIRGSDFMGEWVSTARFKIVHPRGPKYRFIGTGFMGTRARSLSNSDVDFWRPIEATDKKEA